MEYESAELAKEALEKFTKDKVMIDSKEISIVMVPEKPSTYYYLCNVYYIALAQASCYSLFDTFSLYCSTTFTGTKEPDEVKD